MVFHNGVIKIKNLNYKMNLFKPESQQVFRNLN